MYSGVIKAAGLWKKKSSVAEVCWEKKQPEVGCPFMAGSECYSSVTKPWKTNWNILTRYTNQLICLSVVYEQMETHIYVNRGKEIPTCG